MLRKERLKKQNLKSQAMLRLPLDHKDMLQRERMHRFAEQAC